MFYILKESGSGNVNNSVRMCVLTSTSVLAGQKVVQCYLKEQSITWSLACCCSTEVCAHHHVVEMHLTPETVQGW